MEELNMHVDKLMDVKNVLSENNVIISFTGLFSQGIIQEIGLALQKVLQVGNEMDTFSYDVFSVFIELAQNISKYFRLKSDNGNSDMEFLGSGMVSIMKSNDRYIITSSNLIENCDVEPLKEKIDFYLSHDKNELKKLYKEKLKKAREGKKVQGWD
jgi:hypothetical protein